MANRSGTVWTDDDARRLLRYGLIVDALAIVAVAAIVASGCYARAAHGRVEAAYRSGYDAGYAAAAEEVDVYLEPDYTWAEGKEL